MGLDMYLSRSLYVKNWAHEKNEEGHIPHEVIVKGKYADKVFPAKIKRIVEEAMYWRKANQIHKWFVDNVQEGEDNCAEYYVSDRQIVELYNIVKRVLKDKDEDLALELLPPQEGFFFGNSEFDEWYWSQLEATAEGLEPYVKCIEAGEEVGEFYYQASW